MTFLMGSIKINIAFICVLFPHSNIYNHSSQFFFIKFYLVHLLFVSLIHTNVRVVQIEFQNQSKTLILGGINYSSTINSQKIWSELPGTFTETQSINDLFKKNNSETEFYFGDKATESVFKEKIKNSQIIHISTHGFFFPDPESKSTDYQNVSLDTLIFRGSSNYAKLSFTKNKNPLMRSGLALSNANDILDRDPLKEGEDGVLTALEVSNMDLSNTQMVVLSACETGLGDIKGHEGVYGLQRAFKIAGAKSLIMSLWQVPDNETAEFMKLFYENLFKLKDIQIAFSSTQKTMRQKYKPYYWAAFVLIE